MQDTPKIGDIVTLPIKNRWGIDCAATINSVDESEKTFDATVWNMDGPGADREITKIPFDLASNLVEVLSVSLQ